MSEASEAKAKWRKKPVVIDAVQFDPQGAHKMKLPDGVDGCPSPNADNWGYSGCKFWIETLEGRMEVKRGDWVITGVNGEKYPCKPDIFAKTYEPADASDPAAHLARCARMEEALKYAQTSDNLLKFISEGKCECDWDTNSAPCMTCGAKKILARIAAALSSAPVAREGESK